jgi:hypothetical protein
VPTIIPGIDVAAPARTILLGSLAFLNANGLGVRLSGLRLQGWDGGPASSLQVTQKLRAPGGWSSADPQLTPRTLGLTGFIVGPDAATVIAACDAIKAAVTLAETDLTVIDDGVAALTMRVARQGEVLIDGTPTATVKKFSIGLVAADPRKFGTPQSQTTALPSATGGITVPYTVPFAINSTVVTGQISMTNPGNMAGPVTARINGPAPAGGIITHTSDLGTRVLSVNLPLGVGEWVDIDMEAQTVLAQGQASRSQWVNSRGFAAFDPGGNTWSFSAPATSAATLTITATPASE